MNVYLTKEERLLQTSAREFLKDKIRPIAAEQERKGPLGEALAKSLLKEMAHLGFIGPFVPESEKGPQLNHTEAGLIYLELGKVWASLAIIALFTSCVIAMISSAKNDKLKDRYLFPLLKADIIGAAAVTEPSAGTDTAAVKATAFFDEDMYIVNGQKSWVSNGGIADIICLSVNYLNLPKDQNGKGFLLAERKASGVLVSESPKMGLKGLSTAAITFTDCPVPETNTLLDNTKEKQRPVRCLQKSEACLLSAVALGVCEAAFEQAVSYARQRVQFGKALGRFQMIAKMIAEMATGLDAARLMCFRALKMLDENKPCSKEVEMALVSSMDLASVITSKAVQIHGAYGYSDELPLERYYRDARCLDLLNGTTYLHQLRIAEDITGIASFN